MTDLTDALALHLLAGGDDGECDHEFVDAAGRCIKCNVPWADAMRGFGSNVQQLSGKVKRVVRG